MTWYDTLVGRAGSASVSKDHPSIRWGNIPEFSQATTRQEIVDFYEGLYNEIVESFHGHQERITELEGEVKGLQYRVADQRQELDKAWWLVDHANRQFDGLVNVLSQLPPPRPPETGGGLYAAPNPNLTARRP